MSGDIVSPVRRSPSPLEAFPDDETGGFGLPLDPPVSASASLRAVEVDSFVSPPPLSQRAVVQVAPSGAQVALADEEPELYIFAGGGYVEVKLSTPQEKETVKKCNEDALAAIKNLTGFYAQCRIENGDQDLTVENIQGLNAKAGIVVLKIQGKIKEVEIKGKTSEGYFGKINTLINSHFKCQLKTYDFTDGGKYPIGDNSLPSGSRATENLKKEKKDSEKWKKPSPKSEFQRMFPRISKLFSTPNRVDGVTRQLVEKLEDKNDFPNAPESSAAEEKFKKRMQNAEKFKVAFKEELDSQKTDLQEKIAAKDTQIDAQKDGTTQTKITDKIKQLQKDIEAKTKEINDLPSGAADKDAKLAELTQLNENLKAAKAQLAPLEDEKAQLEQKLGSVENKLKSVENLDFAALNAVMFTRCRAGDLSTPEQKLKAARLLHSAMILYLSAYKTVRLKDLPPLSLIYGKLKPDDPKDASDPQDDENYNLLSSIFSSDEKKYCLKVASMLLGRQTSRRVYIDFAEECRAPYSGKPFEEDFLDALDEFENPTQPQPEGAIVSLDSAPAPAAALITPEEKMKAFAKKYLKVC